MTTLKRRSMQVFAGVSMSVCSSWSSAQPRPAPSAQPPAATATATADEAEHTRGLQLRQEHRDAEAREVFRAIFARTREMRALARQAAAEAAAGEWVAAEAHLTEALASADDRWINQNRAALEADLESFRQRVGLLDVSTSTPGAELWLAGVRAASLPLERPLRVPAGSLSFEVRAEGFAPSLRTVSVVPGARVPTREVVNLTQVTRTPPPAAEPLAASVVPILPPEALGGESSSWFTAMHISGLTLAGVGLIGFGVGAAGFLAEANHNDDSDRDCLPSGMMKAANPACDAALDAAENARTLGIVGVAAGAAFLAGGVVLMIIPGSRPARRTSGLAPTAGPGDVGLGLRMTF